MEILAVNVGESDIAIESFVERHGLTFLVLKDKDQAVTEAYDNYPIPASLSIRMEKF
ncbi:redoxin domain-containing protein [Geobacillus sp. BMUD]|uniref:redoxin domain-containing protein n=1 Tax=Geobacillus sp. BMUD TaxID=2508876 RepID=UPI001492BCE2|nr:redoxin domain-containing protein [Geobacillus sp. BMUD]